MKVFVSWSGSRSKAVAELLNDWIKCVLQATRPWISTRDIDRGALWFSEISDQLKDTTVGIVCLTQENKNKPWILFESGALAKGLSSNRVCTFLVDLKPADLEDPLAQFNHTIPEKDSVWELVRTLNGCLSTNSLDERILEQVYATYWGQFEKKFKELLKLHPPVEKHEPRSEKNLLAEILDNTRFLSQRIRSLEARIDGDTNRDRFDRPNRVPKSVANEMIFNMAKAGASHNEIMSKMLEVGLPKSYIFNQLMDCKEVPGDSTQS